MGCEHAQAAGGQTSPSQFEENTLSEVKRVIAVLSGKGGVGKSFVTGAIATELARHGHKVGVLDADITGPSIPKMFGMSGRHVHALGNLMLPEISEHGVKVMSSNLLLQNETDPVLWRGPVIAGAIRQFWSETSWGPIDYLLVDMPPGTGDVALTVFQSLPVDGIVIVTSPQDLVSMIVAKAVNMAEKMNVPILGIVENMSYIECPDCGKKIEVFGKSKLPEVAERYNLDILGTLPINPALAEACDKGEVETALPDGMLPKAVSAVEAITPHETDEAYVNTSAFYDVLVIGGGASGLAAAITAARAGKSVCIVERDVACGLKLLATGNGRCNLSNESIDPQRYNHPAFVESVMGPQPEQELMGFFSSLGIMTTSEEGRLYPRSLRAESVRDALLNVCDRLGITLICGANVASAHKASEGWALQIDRPARALKAKKHDDRKSELRSLRKALADVPRKNEALEAHAVIIATGGNPTGIADTFRLPLTSLRPILCPVSATVVGDRAALKTLDGLRVRARLTLARNHNELWHEDGEVLFRTFGISGVAVFNLSRRIQHGDTILLDVFPDLSKDELLDMLNRRVELLGGFSPRDPRWLDGMLAPQLSRVVCTAFEQCHPGSNDVIHLVSILKHFKLLVEGTAEERSAQVTRGGVSVESISTPSLRARSAVDAPLYVCGEALDIDADCGGFNLAWAWLSGIRAASSL